MWNTDKPKKKGWYIVTVLNSKKRISSCAYWTGNYWTQFGESEEDGKYLEVNVLAWMALPNPHEK